MAANLVQRILLVTDGTVTNILEAYAGERIRVVKIRQSIDPAAADDPDLELEAGEDVMRREVLLQGRDSRRPLVHALSHIVPDRLSPAVRSGLLGSDKPIGHLLEENRTETYRQILWSRRERAGEHGLLFGILPSDTMVARSYRILAGGWPIMLITERFPLDSFHTEPTVAAHGVLAGDTDPESDALTPSVDRLDPTIRAAFGQRREAVPG